MALLILESDRKLRGSLATDITALGIFNTVLVAKSIIEAEALIIDNKISMFVVNLDLEDGSGHEFMERVRSNPIFEFAWIIAVAGKTDGCQVALDAINQNRCDRFILKPFEPAYLCEIILDLAQRKMVPTRERRRLRIKRKSMDYFFDHDDIVYMETVEKVAYIYTANKKYRIGRMTLSELYHQLDDEKRFQRVHRSYIVNVDYIDHIKKRNNQNQIKIKHYDLYIPVGRTYRDQLEDV